MAKANKQERIDFIISYLKKGESRISILSKFVKKWQCSDRTFDRLLKEAQKQHKEVLDKANNLVNNTFIEGKVEAAKNGLKSNLEIEQRLLQIGWAEIDVQETTISEQFGVTEFKRKPTPSEQRSALETVLKMRGGFAPEKHDVKFTPVTGMEIK